MKNPILNIKKDIPKSDTASAVPKVSQVVATVETVLPLVKKTMYVPALTLIRISADNEALTRQNFDVGVEIYNPENGQLLLALGTVNGAPVTCIHGFAFYTLPKVTDTIPPKVDIQVSYAEPKMFYNIPYNTIP